MELPPEPHPANYWNVRICKQTEKVICTSSYSRRRGRAPSSGSSSSSRDEEPTNPQSIGEEEAEEEEEDVMGRADISMKPRASQLLRLTRPPDVVQRAHKFSVSIECISKEFDRERERARSWPGSHRDGSA